MDVSILFGDVSESIPFLWESGGKGCYDFWEKKCDRPIM